MEVRSDSGLIREHFGGGGAVPAVAPAAAPPSTSPSIHNMRLSFTPDGSAIYKPIANPAPYSSGPVLSSGDLSPASSGPAMASTLHHGLNINVGDPIKKKRGRPRKYEAEGAMALALSPFGSGSPTAAAGGFSSLSGGSIGAASAFIMESGKKKGRPPGSSKKQQLDALGPAGIGFTPHVITVKAGEDVSSKIMSFSQNGLRAVCVLSANGAISNVTLRQAATSGGTVTYEGRFEILSLSGSYLVLESGGQRSRTGGLSVSLAGPDGRVLGGGVAGILTAASPVQVVVGSFTPNGRKEPKHIPAPVETGFAPGLFSGSGMAGGSSPPSRGTQSESSGGGPESPPNQSNNIITWKH